MDLCDAIGCEFVYTTSASCPTCQAATPEAMADLVEYSFGNESTAWGRKRISHGHPKKYSLKYVELGNEQFNPDWAAQVTAMQARAVSLGEAEKLVISRCFVIGQMSQSNLSLDCWYHVKMTGALRSRM